jgi:hypothetical protein
MGVVWSKEVPRGRQVTGNRNEGAVYTREFLVRVNSPATSLIDITNSPGLAYGDKHPDDQTVFLDSYSGKPADDSGLLYLCSYEYRKQDPQDQAAENAGGGDQPGGLDFRPPVWGGTSSVVTRPIYKDIDGDTMTNSAGEPLEDLEAEQAEEKLTLTQYYLTHGEWMGLARSYTNAVNEDLWNGGAARTWKCQGCSKKLNIENRNGVTVIYWEVTWEFAYKADEWTLKPWDIGFHQLVNSEGDPEPYGSLRAQIKGQDKKPVRKPVGLDCSGVAVPAGAKPCELEFFIYEEMAFVPAFGELFTPSVIGGA